MRSSSFHICCGDKSSVKWDLEKSNPISIIAPGVYFCQSFPSSSLSTPQETNCLRRTATASSLPAVIRTSKEANMRKMWWLYILGILAVALGVAFLSGMSGMKETLGVKIPRIPVYPATPSPPIL